MKQNDWIVASLNNPQYTASDFRDLAGLTLDNTQLLSRDEYLKSNFIRNNDLFKDKDGNFKEEKFNYFYDLASKNFKDFSEDAELSNYQYSLNDVTRPTDAPVKNDQFTIKRVTNPDQITVGIAGLQTITEPTRSKRSLAQDSKIYDPENNVYLDKSVNEISLFSNPVEYIKSLFGDPLVYATYDEDTIEIDPITGREIKHQKGEWKTNEYGRYYTEKANGRNLLGKTVVSASDYLTSEDSTIQKYDFFDADDLDKSTIGSIVNNVITLLPLATPAGSYYAGLLVAREISKTLPILSNIISGLSSNEQTNNKLLNTIAAYGEKFTGSTSDYAQENTFSLENITNMIGEVVSQFAQQKAIVSTFNKLVSGNKSMLESASIKAADEYMKKTKSYLQNLFSGKISPSQFKQYVGFDADNIGKLGEVIKNGAWQNTIVGKHALNKYIPSVKSILENRGKTGSDLALAYMAIVSNTDVYESIIEKGGTPFEAASIALGSTIGMFALDKYLGLGELLYEQNPARKALRQTAREMVESYAPKAKEKTTQTILGNLKQGIKLGQEIVDNYRYNAQNRDLGIVGKAIGEALEETGEELITDFTKQLGEIAGQLGYFSQTDYGAWENAFDRYAMSFLGGAIGGGIYGAQFAIENKGKKAQEFQNDVIYLLRQGKKKELISEINKAFNKGKGGSKDIAWTEDGQILTADNGRESVSEHNRKQLLNIIEQLDLILNENQLNLSEDELFDKMVQGDYRVNALNDWLQNGDTASAKSISYLSRFQDDFNELTQAIINKRNEINELNKNTVDNARSSQEYKDNLARLETELQELLDQKEYLFGEGSLGYVEKTLFAMDPVLAGRFGFLNYNQFIRQLYGVNTSQLTESELEYANKQWQDYQKHQIKTDVDTAFKIYKSMESSIAPVIEKLGNIDIQTYIDQINELRKHSPFDKQLDLNDKLPTQTDEEYQAIFTRNEGEDEETYQTRVKQHQEAVAKYNNDNLYNWIQEYLNNSITTTDQRYIASIIPTIKSEIINQALKGIKIDNLELQNTVRDLVRTYENKNPEELREAVQQEVRKVANKLASDSLAVDNTEVLFQDDFDAIASWLTMLGNLSPEEKQSHNVLEDYVYDNDGTISYSDLSNLFNYKLSEFNGDSQAVYDWFLDFGINLSSNPTYKALQTILGSNSNSPVGDVPGIISDTIFEENQNAIASELFDQIDKQVLSPILDLLDNNPVYQTLVQLVNAGYVNNPALEVVNQVSKNSPNKGINLEQFLTDIYTTYNNGETAQDFQLSANQVEILKQFLQDLDVAQAYLYAASTDSSFSSPVGHNKAINNFINSHKEVFSTARELPEIDSKLANFLIQELNNYKTEIQSWLNRHNLNTQNRDAKLFKIEPAIAKTVTDFFKINRESFKVNDIDLLEGFESINLDNTLSSILSIEELLYQNYNRFLNAGYTLNDFLDFVLPKITKIENIVQQSTTKLDENVDYSSLTDYDKFQLIISCIAASSRDYYTGLLEFLNKNKNIAPISPQEYISKLVYAQQQNPNLINEALKYVSEKTGNTLQVLNNTSIVIGRGGVGKTFAVAGLNLGQGDNVWISGPEQDQIDNLHNSLSKSRSITKNELLNTIFGGKIPDLSTLYTTSKTKEGITVIKLKENLPISEIKDKPNAIVIDESTHYSTPEIAVISEFCNKNGINLLLIGDDYQNGYNEGKLHNIQRDQILTWRTPQLTVSLRSNNILKTSNQNPLIAILDQIANVPMSSLAQVAKKIYDDYVKDLEFIYNTDTNLVGEIITSQLTPEILSKIPKDSNVKIGFIGEESSYIYQALVKAGYNPIVKSPKQVQGQEFDYVIIDQKWELNIDSNNWANTGIALTNFIQNLYTLISRSRNGSILIDNGLSNIIRNRQVKYSGTASTIEQSVQRFRENRLPQIEKALNDSKSLPIRQDIVRVEFTLPNGDTMYGLQQNKEGVTEITFPVKPRIKPSDINLTLEEIVGNRDQFSSDEEYNSAIEKANNGIPLDKIIVNSNDTVTVVLDGKNIETPITLNDIFKPRPNINKVTVLGTELSQTDLDEETEGKEDNSNENKEEINDSNEQNNNFAINFNYPITVFSNVSYSGIDTSKEIWSNDEDSTSDLGIFIHPGDRIERGNKAKYVQMVLQMKNIFKYGTLYYDRLDPEIRRRFSKGSFENAIINNQFYIQVTDINNSNRLIGLTEGTGLSNNNRATYRGKIIKLVVKIADNDGKIWTISLGGLNNPDTWKSNIDVIRDGIQRRISEGANNTNELEQYSKDLPNIIDQYKNTLDQIINRGEEVQIEAPNFSQNTRIYKLNNSYRLENMNDTSSPYGGVSPYQVQSSPYINLSDLPGISEKVKGKAIMFVSDNLFLYPSELKQIYINQLSDPSLPKQVRMLVLDNLGVSFQSLFTKKYMDIYKQLKGNITFTVPFRAAPMAIRMYISMWNFRAGLNRFLSSYNEFKTSNNYTDSQIEDLTREESELFIAMQENNPNLDESTFRNNLSDEQKQKFQPLWDFNDRLSDWCKEFKLGYNNLHGAYIRTFNNVNSEFYPNTDKVLGVYIDYETASQYKASLDALFDNIINPLFPAKSAENTSRYITTKLSNLEGWFSNTAPKPLTLTFKDGEGEEEISVKLDDHNRLASLPFLLIKVGNYMNQYSRSLSTFIEWDQDGTLPNRYSITIDGVNNGEPLNWRAAVEPFSNITEYDPEIPYERTKYVIPVDRNNNLGTRDCRVEDMFSLMFHGLISTKVPNDFTRKDIRADYAYFKYGFFADPLVVQRSNLEGDQQFDETLTNQKLLGCNAAAGGGYIAIKLNPITQKRPVVQNTQQTQSKIDKQLETNLQNILNQIGKAGSVRRKRGSTIDDFFNLVQNTVKTNFTNLISMGTQITVDSFPNIIEDINRESTNIVVKKLSDREEFKGKKLVEIDNQADFKILTFDNGDKYRVYILNNQVMIDKEKTPGNVLVSYDINTVTNSINEILNRDEFREAIEEELDVDEITDTINKFFRNNTDIARNTYIRLVNEVQNIIGNSDIDKSIKDQIKQALETLKSTDCTI